MTDVPKPSNSRFPLISLMCNITALFVDSEFYDTTSFNKNYFLNKGKVSA